MDREFYRQNERYSDLIAKGPYTYQTAPMTRVGAYHDVYVAALAGVDGRLKRVLDVGSGTGEAVAALAEAGHESFGVEISESSLARATGGGEYRLYKGSVLPFADHEMDAVGCCNVLEHVDEPVALLDEMVRVLRPGGTMVVCCPNFLRVAGWRDYHPRMRGLFQKLKNARALLRRAREPFTDFERMPSRVTGEWYPDQDATVVTNALDLERYFASRGFEVVSVSCIDRPVPSWVRVLADATPLKYGVLNAFVTAHKPA